MPAVAEELQAAIGCLTVLRPPGAAGAAALAGGLAWYPLVGLAVGGAAAGAAALTATVAPSLAGGAGVLVLELLSGPRPLHGLAVGARALFGRGGAEEVVSRLRRAPGWGGMTVAAAALGAKVWAASTLPPSARAAALALAPMLGAWAVTVQCYGSAPGRARGVAAKLLGRARFREFGWASVLALGVALSVAEAAGLVVVVAVALVTVGLRLYVHRRLDGFTGRLLAATREVVETTVLVTLGVLAGV